MSIKPIYVTHPTLAPLNEFVEFLKEPWASGILTHNGPLLQRFERELSQKLNIKYLCAVTSGTIALQMAIKTLGLKGEIITSPFSWIATVSAIKSEGCIPIFSDINENSLNIDPLEIEKKITKDTVAIMPVHVFGNPCDIDSIEAIAKRYKLRVIYDAAHALGSTYKGQSILKYGDISCTSFHGTKLLNTAEGGACVTKNMKFYEKLKRIRFFGHDENKEIIEDGLNGKMTEIHAALGLANLKYFSEILADRKRKYLRYIELLSKNDQITFQSINEQDCNYSYFPIIFKSEKKLIETERRMNRNNIYPRRYFHPSLNTLSKIIAYDVATISEDIASRILCLPLHKELSNKQIELIASCVY